jgi:hypothetical protein
LLAKLRISGNDHLIIDHRKYSKDDHGNRVSSYALPGFSGGAVIDLGKISAPETATAVPESEPRLAGLFANEVVEIDASCFLKMSTPCSVNGAGGSVLGNVENRIFCDTVLLLD